MRRFLWTLASTDILCLVYWNFYANMKYHSYQNSAKTDERKICISYYAGVITHKKVKKKEVNKC